MSSDFDGTIDLAGGQNLAVSSNGRVIAVCVPASGEVVIVNAADGLVTKRLGVQGRARSVVFSSDDSRVYIDFVDRDVILELSTSDWRQVREVPLRVYQMLSNLKPLSAYAMFGRDFVELDLGGNPHIKQTLSISLAPHSSALSGDGKHASVSDGDFIYALNLREWSDVRVNVFRGGNVLALNSDGSHLYLSSPENDWVQVYDLVNKKVIAEFKGAAAAAALTPDDSLAFILRTNGAKMTVVDVKNNYKVVTEITVGGEPKSVKVNASGTHVYLTNGSVLKALRTNRWST